MPCVGYVQRYSGTAVPRNSVTHARRTQKWQKYKIHGEQRRRRQTVSFRRVKASFVRIILVLEQRCRESKGSNRRLLPSLLKRSRSNAEPQPEALCNRGDEPQQQHRVCSCSQTEKSAVLTLSRTILLAGGMQLIGNDDGRRQLLRNNHTWRTA